MPVPFFTRRLAAYATWQRVPSTLGRTRADGNLRRAIMPNELIHFFAVLRKYLKQHKCLFTADNLPRKGAPIHFCNCE